MGISERTSSALAEMSYVEATEVQEKSIPLILQGEEIIVRSQTGTGKTAAFGIGLIEIISKDKTKKALILAPTRELVIQITKELRSIAKNHRMGVYAIYGGQGMEGQVSLLRRGYDIIVATPGRLLDHVRRGTLNLGLMNCIVLDEADRMLDMGFKEDIDTILDQVSKTKQMMLFSATIDQRIREISGSYMKTPEIVEIGPEGKVETIEEEFIELTRKEKIQKLHEIIARETSSRTIVFVGTKKAAEFVCHRLMDNGMDARFLHGGKTQSQRERTLRDFREGRFRILVATDVAARGLHIEEVSHIISYDKAMSHDTHTHRIGRTGRMGKSGKAITFVETDPLPAFDYSKGRRGGGRGGYGRPSGGGYGRRPSYGHGGGSRSYDSQSRSGSGGSEHSGGYRGSGSGRSSHSRDSEGSHHRKPRNRSYGSY